MIPFNLFGQKQVVPYNQQIFGQARTRRIRHKGGRLVLHRTRHKARVRPETLEHMAFIRARGIDSPAAREEFIRKYFSRPWTPQDRTTLVSDGS